jgi:glycosyltransferase involved in cell wall biosynthesis
VSGLVEDGVTGWRFAPLDPSSVAAAIDRFLSSPPESLEEMGARGRDVAEELRSEAVASSFVQAIADQLRPPTGAPGSAKGDWFP